MTTPPATQTVARPATQPASPAQLQAWFNDLAASDAVVRERAYSELLGLDRQDLAALKEVVGRSRPVAPSQAAALRDVVTHVYLSGEPYRAEKSGFLGVMASAELYSVEVPGEEGVAGEGEGPQPEPGAPRTGVPIEVRLPGFCAFRALREGDIVLGVVAPVERPMRDWNEFRIAVMSFAAGDTITFELLRGGKLIRVPVRLDAFPADARMREAWPNEVIPARAAKAEEYWAQHFEPLVDDRVSSAAR